MILTVDAGTTATKVALWGDDGLVALGRATVTTSHPRPGWAEQDPAGWWASVVAAAARVRAQAPSAFGAVTAVSCTGARQTFVPVASDGTPLGPGLVWSDRRAGAEAAALATTLSGSGGVVGRTGVPLDAESMAAKVVWMAAHEPDRLAGAAWLLGPRDLLVWLLSGEVVTDATMAGRSGLYELGGDVAGGSVGPPVDALAGRVLALLPPVVAAGSVVGGMRPAAAEALGLRPGTTVVTAAGDRACEVLGAGASEGRPLVSWGTTANVSAPVSARPAEVPPGLVMSPGAAGGWLLEGGLSAAGSLVDWLGRLTGSTPDALSVAAAGRPAGARGVLVLPWLDGARAPWWRDDARAAVLGLSSAHDAADLARAVFEAVAYDVRRCLRAMEPVSGAAAGLALGGAGSGAAVWPAVLTAVTGLGARGRRSGEAASAGAALLGLRATGDDRAVDALDPVATEVAADPADVARYGRLWPRAERVAVAVAGLDLDPHGDGLGGPGEPAGPGAVAGRGAPPDPAGGAES